MLYWRHHTMTSILLFGLLAAGANVLGGLVLVKSGAHRYGERFLKYLVALGAGFMLAAIFIEILPGNCRHLDERSAECAGIRSRRTCHGAAARRLPVDTVFRAHARSTLPFRRGNTPGIVSASILGVHALSVVFVFTPSSTVSRLHPLFSVNFKVGILVFIAILLHKMPEGFTVASIMLATGRSTRKA